MTLLNKILIALLAIAVISIIGLVAYQSHQLSVMQDQMNKSVVAMQQLQDNIVRSSSQYVSKADLDNFAKQNSIDIKTINDNLSSLNASLTGINKVVIVSSGQTQKNVPSTTTTPNPDPTTPNTPDPFGYLANQQSLALNEQFGDTKVPIGEVGFSAWQQNPWNINVFPRSYNVVNVLGTDENGRHTVYNKMTINSNGKDYPVKIQEAQFVEQYPENHWSFWNPHVYLGVSGGIGVSQLPVKGEATPNLKLGVITYGKTKASPDIGIMQVGVGYELNSQKPEVSISPIQFNLAPIVPLLKNTYVGPEVGINTGGNITVGIGIAAGL